MERGRHSKDLAQITLCRSRWVDRLCRRGARHFWMTRSRRTLLELLSNKPEAVAEKQNKTVKEQRVVSEFLFNTGGLVISRIRDLHETLTGADPFFLTKAKLYSIHETTACQNALSSDARTPLAVPAHLPAPGTEKLVDLPVRRCS